MEEIYRMYEPKTTDEMTWREVDEAIKGGAETIILIVGSTENHGSHLPLGTDTFGPLESAKRAVLKLENEGIKTLIAPPVPFGMSHHHLPFPGSIALRPETLHNLIVEVCQCFVDHGFKRIVFIMGHSGPEQRAVLINARLEIAERWGIPVGIFDRADPAVRAKIRKGMPGKKKWWGSHAGEGETADILACRPKLVHQERAKPYYPEEAQAFYTKPPALRYPARWGQEKLKSGRFSFAPGPFEYTLGEGYAGDPTAATAEYGNRRLDFFAEELADLIKAMIEAEKAYGKY
jgi:creatinine amidohydrolase/Fe(II)-dependent formamide hydrolase-like protein